MHSRALAANLDAVVANGLDRTAFLGFFAASFFFGVFRLLVHERIAAIIVAFEIIRGRFATEIAINALIIDVILAGSVFRISIRNVSHKVSFTRAANMTELPQT